MTELEHSIVNDLALIRAASSILKDVVPACNHEIDQEEFTKALVCLRGISDRLSMLVQIMDQG